MVDMSGRKLPNLSLSLCFIFLSELALERDPDTEFEGTPFHFVLVLT
jgi:hypothetical protein